MGMSLEVWCKTCKVCYYLGYGGAKTQGQLKTNFESNHDDTHEYFFWHDEFGFRKDDKLWSDGCGFVDDAVVLDIADYEYRDFS